MRTRLTAVAAAAISGACGGGGGDGGGPPPSQAYVLSFSEPTLQASTVVGSSAPIAVTVTIDRPIPETVNVAIVDAQGVIAPTVSLTPLSATSYQVVLSTNAGLAAGSYQGTLQVRLCRDAPQTCASPLPGSPWSVAYDIQVAASAPAPSPAPAPAPPPAPAPAPTPEPPPPPPPPPPGYQVQFSVASVAINDYVDELPPAALSAQLTPTNGAGAVYPRVVDPAGVFAPNPPTQASGYSLSTTLYVGTTTPGVYQGHIELRLCKDLPCTSEYVGSPALLPYSVKVMAATNLTPMSALGSAPEWAMHQGNAGHTGYVPVTLDASKFNRRWRWVNPTGTSSSGLHPVVTDGGKVYVARSGYFVNSELQALNEADKSTAWSYNFGTVFALNPPSTGDGKVWAATSGHSDTFMWAFAAGSGQQQSKTAFTSQWERYYAPTIFGGAVYTNGGYYGGMVSFATGDGAQTWFNSVLPQVDNWTPAVDAGHAYVFLGASLYAVNRLTGAIEFTIPDAQASSWSQTGTPMLGSGGRAFVVTSSNEPSVNRLVAFDTAGRSIAWAVPGRFAREPANAHGVIYIANGSQLEARKESDGSLLWAWTPPEVTQSPFDGGLQSNVVVTDNLVFVSTATAVYAITLDTHEMAWNFPKPGRLALSPRGVLYIVTPTDASGGAVIAVNLQ